MSAEEISADSAGRKEPLRVCIMPVLMQYRTMRPGLKFVVDPSSIAAIASRSRRWPVTCIVWGEPGTAPPWFIVVRRDGPGLRIRPAALSSTVRTHKMSLAGHPNAKGPTCLTGEPFAHGTSSRQNRFPAWCSGKLTGFAGANRDSLRRARERLAVRRWPARGRPYRSAGGSEA